MDIIFALVFVVIGMVIIRLFDMCVAAWKFWCQLNEKTCVEKPKTKLPHEIFPEILEWREGDRVYNTELYSSSAYSNCDFVGVSKNQVHLKDRWGGIKSYSIEKAKKSLSNITAKSRIEKARAKEILEEIKIDPFNEFLKARNEVIEKDNEK